VRQRTKAALTLAAMVTAAAGLAVAAAGSAATPSLAGTFKFTMRLIDYAGQQVTQQFTLTIQS
jgi:anthranilate phosphoribosyltransferase